MELLTIKEVAASLVCTTQHVYNLIGKEKLTKYKDGKFVRVSKESLDEYIREMKVKKGGD